MHYNTVFNNQARKWIDTNIQILHPDTLYKQPSITFIYDINNEALYSDEYSATHYDLKKQVPNFTGVFRDPGINENFVLGRLGYLNFNSTFDQIDESDDDDDDDNDNDEFGERFGAIAFWNHTLDPRIEEKIISELKTQYPNYLNGAYVVFGDVGKGDVETEFVNGTNSNIVDPHKEDEKCTRLNTINIQNKPVSLPQILSQLHMVRGQELGYLKSGFCSQYQQLKSQAKECPVQSRMLDTTAQGFKCGDNKDLYNYMKQAERLNYRQKLRDIFNSPEKIDQEFRTQKEIDDAWDELQLGKKSYESFSFKEWLVNQS
jgi:hypothetical protein